MSIATRYRLYGSGFEPYGDEIFRTHSDRPRGPPFLLYNAYRVSLPGVKRPGRGVDRPPPYLAPSLTTDYSYTSIPTRRLHGLFWGKVCSSFPFPVSFL